MLCIKNRDAEAIAVFWHLTEKVFSAGSQK